MATILVQRQVADGFDVDCTLSDSSFHTFHFATGKPANVQTAVNQAETDWLASQIPFYQVTLEDGTVV